MRLLLLPAIVLLASGGVVAQPRTPASPSAPSSASPSVSPSASPSVPVERPIGPVLDEAELLARLAADPRLARVDAEIEVARAEVTAAAVPGNPSLTYDREATTSGAGLATDYLRLSVPLEISGRRAAHRAAASAEVTAVTAEVEAARLALTVEALRAFRVAQYERERGEVLRAERAALAGAVEIVRRRVAAGATSGYDLQRIELALADSDDALAAAAAALEVARLELGSWAGLPGGVEASGALEVPPAPAALETAVAEALQRRPELRAAAARGDGARALARAAGRGWIPELALSAGLLHQELSADDAAWGYTAGVALSLPLFDHGQGERARARAQARRAEATRQLLTRTVPAALRSRHAALRQAIERARALEERQLARLPQLLSSAEIGYREGAGDIVALVDAYTTARDLRLRALAQRRDAQLASLDYWLALGRRP